MAKAVGIYGPNRSRPKRQIVFTKVQWVIAARPPFLRATTLVPAFCFRASAKMSQDSKRASLHDTDTTAKPEGTAGKSLAPGQSWKQTEEHVLPPNRIGIVFFGLMSCTFLAALDQVFIHKH